MWKLSLISLCLLFFIPAFRAEENAHALPPGPMQAKATTACLECHNAQIIQQQRLSKAAWTKEVDKMTKWGALVEPQDRDALIEYLSANFGMEKPTYQPPRAASGRSKR